MEIHDIPNPDLPKSDLIAPKLMEDKAARYFKFVQEHYYELFRAEDHDGLNKNSETGRNNIAPEKKSCILLLQYLTQCSDKEAIRRMKFDIRWKNVLGLKIDENALCDRSLIVKYRTQLIVEQKTEIIFKRAIELCLKYGMISEVEAKKLRVDSTAIYGKGAVKDTYNLIFDGLKNVIRTYQLVNFCDEEAARQELNIPYDFDKSIKAQLDIDWNDAQAGREALTELVEVVLKAYETGKEDTLIDDSFDFIGKILGQDVECADENGEFSLKDGVEPDRIISFTDQEQRHGRKSASKRFNGYKAQVATSGDHGIVTAIDVVPGNEHDSKALLSVVEQAEDILKSKI